MQRIDENTYIDETLVTCAEYQLFIDEMLGQGKYYQPDHWTSYEFPAGKALEPIVGVRRSDAVAFCDWLAKREGESWKYRLPTQEEASKFRIYPPKQSLLGYWLGGTDTPSRFAWIGNVPDNPRRIDFDRARTIAIYNGSDLGRTRVHAGALDLDLAIDQAQNIALFDKNVLAHEQARSLDRDRTRALDLARDRSLDRAVGDNRELALDLYIDIFTLQERLAGRAPAFEGIRLVKERIR